MVEDRWIHIDPCEAAYNDNKMYLGWGKKHTYIVAFGRPSGGAEISFEDVTADYADEMEAVRRRRDLSDQDLEKALESAVVQWNDERDESVKLIARWRRIRVAPLLAPCCTLNLLDNPGCPIEALAFERRLMCNACVAAPLIGPYLLAGLPVWVVRNLRMKQLSHQGQAASLGASGLSIGKST